MSENKKTNGMPEFLRKFIVSLKRHPQNIALVVYIIAFLIYNLNLTYISHSTARIQGKNMGIFEFIIMLASTLGVVCFMNSFPRRKNVNIPMLLLNFVLNGLVIFSDVMYRDLIWTALNRADHPIPLEDYIAKAFNMLQTHMIFMVIGIVLTLLLPVYSKLLRKINTNIDVEGNADISNIELSNE